eukprot:ctg_1092.g241
MAETASREDESRQRQFFVPPWHAAMAAQRQHGSRPNATPLRTTGRPRTSAVIRRRARRRLRAPSCPRQAVRTVNFWGNGRWLHMLDANSSAEPAFELPEGDWPLEPEEEPPPPAAAEVEDDEPGVAGARFLRARRGRCGARGPAGAARGAAAPIACAVRVGLPGRLAAAAVPAGDRCASTGASGDGAAIFLPANPPPVEDRPGGHGTSGGVHHRAADAASARCHRRRRGDAGKRRGWHRLIHTGGRQTTGAGYSRPHVGGGRTEPGRLPTRLRALHRRVHPRHLLSVDGSLAAEAFSAVHFRARHRTRLPPGDELWLAPAELHRHPGAASPGRQRAGRGRLAGHRPRRHERPGCPADDPAAAELVRAHIVRHHRAFAVPWRRSGGDDPPACGDRAHRRADAAKTRLVCDARRLGGSATKVRDAEGSTLGAQHRHRLGPHPMNLNATGQYQDLLAHSVHRKSSQQIFLGRLPCIPRGSGRLDLARPHRTAGGGGAGGALGGERRAGSPR